MGKLLPSQKDQIRTWLRLGFTPQQIEGMAKNQGWQVAAKTVYNQYVPEMKTAVSDDLRTKSESADWFNKEYRAERAAEMAELLFERIMNGEMFAEEVVEKDMIGGTMTTRKPVYFAGMIKNWKDLMDLIGNELGQRKKTVDLNYNKNQNLNISFLIDKIFDEDQAVAGQLKEAEIIDVPSDSDFGDDEGYENIVDEQTDDEIKGLIAAKDDDEPDLFA